MSLPWFAPLGIPQPRTHPAQDVCWRTRSTTTATARHGYVSGRAPLPSRPSSHIPTPETPPTPRATAARPVVPCTILIVEDHAAISLTLAELLEDEGYQVVTTANGQEALTYLRHAAERPTLILLDLMMPVMDGWTFRSLQAQDPVFQAIPVVVMSAISNVRHQQVPITAAAYLPKPLNFHLLLETVARFCVPDTSAESS